MWLTEQPVERRLPAFQIQNFDATNGAVIFQRGRGSHDQRLKLVSYRFFLPCVGISGCFASVPVLRGTLDSVRDNESFACVFG
jgi:hypothetical protein